ncbi:peptidase inhibitor family I36 protein [Curtobacterium sp. S6]|uniref:peptidase inhibitor family I36 protein n=1 Tax=Curtobacterium sp. S6 TaxID=1479623 RepID=UPI0009EC0BC5|nr:peptidase inhibitor family I36 protein [Curtobacterium sp. S6]
MIASWFRKVITVGLVAGGAAGGLVVTSAPAQAHVYSCPTHYECVYEHNNLTGAVQMVSGYLGFADMTPIMHDNVSSWANANIHALIGIGEWRGGHKYFAQVLKPGWYEPNLGSIGFNDRADFVQHM